MTHSQLTQCPHCKASFKVSDEQLNAANGKVRCGACLNIFDAIAYQITSSNSATHESSSSQNKPTSSSHDDELSFDLEETIDLENELLHPSQEDHEDEYEVFADDPEEDKLEKGYSGSTKLGDELSTTFLELDSSTNDKFKTQFLDGDSLDIVEDEGIDESWTASILDDLEAPTDNRIEPSFSNDDSTEKLTSVDTSQDDINPFPPQSDFEQFSQKDLNALSFQYEQDPAPKSKWLMGTFLFLINFGLLLLLLAQTSFFHYERLVKYPKIKELYELACEKIGCELPSLIDVSKIENRNLVVRSHPTTFNALIIETIITNHANFEQAFPDISLSFSNINNQIIAQRLFNPAEYLNKEILAWPGMPADQPIQITLEIIDPGSDAVNYKINFHPHHESNIDQ